MVRVGLTSIGKPRILTLKSEEPFVISGEGWEISVEGEISFSPRGRNMEVKAGEESHSLRGPLRLMPADGAVFEIVWPKARHAKYQGILEISGSFSLSVVNEVTLEQYVRGVIPTEIPPRFHPEAQKALAVAIRTYALKSVNRHKSDGFNLCDTTHCQGFSGLTRDAPWVEKLIEETRGQVLTYDGELIYALYSSDCGGFTRNNEDAGFSRDPWPYLRAVSDNPGEGAEDYCSECPHHTWKVVYARDELTVVLAKSPETMKQIGEFESLEFADLDSSGRWRTVVIKGCSGEVRMPGNKFRELLGPNALKSTRMTLSVSEDGEYTIEGKGFGHGVGLCAFGANGRAKAGQTWEQILKSYYTGAQIQKADG